MIEHMLHVRAIQAGRRWYDEERRPARPREREDDARPTPPGGRRRRLVSAVVALLAPVPGVARRSRASA